MKKQFISNINLFIIAFASLLIIGYIFYTVIDETAPIEPTKQITPSANLQSQKEITKTEEPVKKKTSALDRKDEEPKNTDPAKPAEIIKGVKERPSPVLQKDEYYIEEYSNAKPVRIPPSKQVSTDPSITLLYQFAGSVSGVPAIKDDVIYFGCIDYQGYALNLQNGEIIQKQILFSQPIGSTVLYGDKYIIPQRNGTIQCFDTKTGGLVWNHRSAVHTKKGEIDISISGVRINGSSMWVSKHWGNLYIVDANTGVLSSDPGVHYESRINTLAVSLGSEVVYPNVAGELICYSIDGTKEKWQHTIDSGYMLSLYSDQKYLYFNTTEKELVCFDPVSKKNKWKQKIEGFGYSSLTENDGNLYLAAKDIYAVNKDSGEIIWTCKSNTANGYNRSIDITNDAIYAATEEGLVTKINKKEGSLIKSLDLKEIIKNGVLHHNGVVYISTIAKKLYGVRISN